jgi:hypothetical protein
MIALNEFSVIFKDIFYFAEQIYAGVEMWKTQLLKKKKQKRIGQQWNY